MHYKAFRGGTASPIDLLYTAFSTLHPGVGIPV
jgi:hypothetical protein